MTMEQIIELSKYKIFTKTEGEGLPLLLLHSYWGSHILFEHLAKVFSAKMRVIRIDLPGHGNSGPPPEDYTFDKFAEVLNELLIRLNVREKISIIGHSMGGYAAMGFASKFADRISSLVLMHSPIKSADTRSIKLREREGRLLLKGKKDLLLEVTIPSNFAPFNSCCIKNNAGLLYQLSNEVSNESALRSIYAINNRQDSLGELQSARYPILIIIGKYDRVYSAGGQLDEASQIPNAEVLLLNNSGHMGFLEEEEAVFDRLEVFFKKMSNTEDYPVSR
jgi:pimeloyl-ACP methyl ester carboxylesterase